VTAAAILACRFDPASVGTGASEIAIRTTAEERLAIAKDLGLMELQALEADLAANRDDEGRIQVTGNLRATVVQSCVVSLKPVVQAIDERFERHFAPTDHAAAGSSVDIDPDTEDPPDGFGEEGIDLGAVVVEQLILAIDPYPRAEDAELPAQASGGSEKAESPFAVLKTLGHRQPG
jgi:uncharacterized metal-binding protein YceD (DUF177 family)